MSKALAQWRSELIADLGGPEQVSTQQVQLVELCVRSKLLLDSIDTWLLSQGKLVYGRTKTIYPAVIQRQHLADGLAKHLQMLGLERRGPKPVELSEYLAQTYGNGAASAPPRPASGAAAGLAARVAGPPSGTGAPPGPSGPGGAEKPATNPEAAPMNAAETDDA